MDEHVKGGDTTYEPATRDEICVVAIAEAFRGDGEILCNPIGITPIIGGRLARATFEPTMVMTDAKIKELVDRTPLQRIGEPEELAAMVRFLLSDESSFTTGQTIIASGGRAMM